MKAGAAATHVLSILVFLILMQHAQPGWAAVVHVEARLGDFSDTPAAPTTVAVEPGRNLVIGSSQHVPLDTDYWHFEVPERFFISSISVSSHTYRGFFRDQGGSWFGMQSGEVWRYVDRDEPDTYPALLGGALVGRAAGRPAGTGLMAALPQRWVLPDLEAETYGAGHYTFMYQETGAPTNYGFAFEVTEVPVPGAFPLLLSGLGVLGWCMRRRTLAGGSFRST